MHMFPLGRVIYMPLSPSTTLLGPIPSSSTVPFYNPTFFNNPSPNPKCKFS
jgi:hypothetical protein